MLVSDWLEEFPLFGEVQPLENLKLQPHQVFEEGNPNSNLEQLLYKEDSLSTDIPTPYFSNQPDLFSSSLENTTFIFSDENAFCIKSNQFHDSHIPQVKTPYNSINLSNASTETAETIVVDKLVRKPSIESDESEWNPSHSSCSSDSSPTHSGSFFTSGQEESDDPELQSQVVKTNSIRRATRRTSKSRIKGESLEDKKLRKKEQNKNAATRYRLKKKAEVHEILREEEAYRKEKEKLEAKVLDLQNEIKYLKGLMRELFKAKGLI